MSDLLYVIKQQQLQKSYGELRALVALHYEPMRGRTKQYSELEKLIEEFINELGDLIG
ncbi:hypothetical protein RKD55_004627 [Rossellomorea marisflavi]